MRYANIRAASPCALLPLTALCLVFPVILLEERTHALALRPRDDQVHQVARRVRQLFQPRAVLRRHVVRRLRKAQPPERHDELMSNAIEVARRCCLQARTQIYGVLGRAVDDVVQEEHALRDPGDRPMCRVVSLDRNKGQ